MRTWELYAFALSLTVVTIFVGNTLARWVADSGLERLISVAVVLLGLTLLF